MVDARRNHRTATPTRAFAETLRVRRHDSGIADAPHALFFLYRAAPDAGGRVRTTLDRPLQRFVAGANAGRHRRAAARYHVTDAAAIVVDNRTGEVLAYVGSPDYFSDAALGRNDGVQALRQPGSSLKPFTYELALERGTIRSTTILADVPAAYAIPGGTLYQPADYSGRFSGPVRVRYALANSLNVPAVRVLSDLGVATLLDRLHALGFAHLDRPASYYGLGLTLGSGEVSLWELAQAYADHGARRRASFRCISPARSAPSIARSATRRSGSWSPTCSPTRTRARIRSALHSVLEMPFAAAVKTGTSSDFRDTWTVGFTRDYTVGVWVGNFDGSAMRGVSGVTGAGPLWNRIMLHLYERNAEPPPFTPPRGYVRARRSARRPAARRRAAPAVLRRSCRSGCCRGTYAALARDNRTASRLRISFRTTAIRSSSTSQADRRSNNAQQLALRALGRTELRPLERRRRAARARFRRRRLLAAARSDRGASKHDDGTAAARITIRVIPAPCAQPRFTGFTRDHFERQLLGIDRAVRRRFVQEMRERVLPEGIFTNGRGSWLKSKALSRPLAARVGVHLGGGSDRRQVVDLFDELQDAAVLVLTCVT